MIAELRSLLEGVTVEKRALQSSAARESTQHNRSAPNSPLASPPPSPVRQSSEALPSPSPSPPPQPQQLQPADSLAQLLRGSMLDRPRASGFTIPILGSEAGEEASRTSSDTALPADAIGGGMPHAGGPTDGDSAAAAAKVPRSVSGGAPGKHSQQLQAPAVDTSMERLAQHGLGAVDVAGLQQPGGAWRGADGPSKGATALLAPAGGARSGAMPTEQPATPSNEGREQSLRTGIVTSATSSLTEAAALDSIAALQHASAARAHQSAQHPGQVLPLRQTPGAHLSGRLSPPIGSRGVAAGMTVRPGLTWSTNQAPPRREAAANLGAALGRHEGDWGSAWGAGLTVLPSGASVSDAADASPVSSVDLLAPRPSCIVDVAADPIVPPSPPSTSSAIDRLLRTALHAPVPEEPIEGGAPAALGGNLTTRSATDGGGETVAGDLPVTRHHQEPGQQPRGRRKLVTRSAQEVSSSDLQQALDQSTARSSAPVGLASWRQVVPTSVFALSEDGQTAESAALATRWGTFLHHVGRRAGNNVRARVCSARHDLLRAEHPAPFQPSPCGCAGWNSWLADASTTRDLRALCRHIRPTSHDIITC